MQFNAASFSKPPMSHDDSRHIPGAAIAAVACLIGLPLLLYFGLFALIYVDELVLETYYFAGNSPEWMLKAFHTIYYPLLALFDL